MGKERGCVEKANERRDGSSDEDDNDHPLSQRRAKLLAKQAPEDESSDIYRYKGPIPSRQHPYQTSRNAKHGEFRRPSRPLIDLVTNDWRREKSNLDHDSQHGDREPGFCDLEEEESCPNVTYRLFQNKRSRKMILYFAALIAMLYCGWKWYVQPQVVEEWETKEGFLPDRQNGTFGLARMGDFHGTFVKQLDPMLAPGGVGDKQGKRRLIFVGDIHGCKEEFSSLLEKVGFNGETDHLIATGDAISKGPDSPGVLDELIRVKAESVRGNHEDRVLEAAKTLLGSSLQPQSEAGTSQGYAKDHALLKSLTPEHVQYLRDMPLILHISALLQASPPRSRQKDQGNIASDVYVVHAGLVPHVPIRKQDPYFVMNMRSIDRITHVPSALRQTKKGDSKPWIKIWNWYNERLFRGRSVKDFHAFTDAEYAAQQEEHEKSWLERTRVGLAGLVKGDAEVLKAGERKSEVVIYGHDSKSGLQIMRWSKGLDSGCVSGGQLTALVLTADGRTEVVQVACEGYRK